MKVKETELSDVNSIVIWAEPNLAVMLCSQSRFAFAQTACFIAERYLLDRLGTHTPCVSWQPEQLLVITRPCTALWCLAIRYKFNVLFTLVGRIDRTVTQLLSYVNVNYTFSVRSDFYKRCFANRVMVYNCYISNEIITTLCGSFQQLRG
jgi:hypothetical protein